MRTLTLLALIAFLPFMGKGQSVTITGTFDSTQQTYGCDTVGEGIYTYLAGTSSGLTTGDTIEIHVDNDDGTGLDSTTEAYVQSSGDFDANWYNSWGSPGVKNIQIIAIGPNGNADTTTRTKVISDSCTTIQGNIHLEQDGNCTHNTGEPMMENKTVMVEYNNTVVGYDYTDQNGLYQIQVGANASPYDVTLIDSGHYSLGCPSSATQQVSNPPNYNVDYALDCPTNPDFSVDHGYVWNFRVGWERSIHMSIDGPEECQDSLECVKMVLNQHLSPATTDSTTPAYDAVNGDTVVWDMDTNELSDFYHANLPVSIDQNAPVGDTICVELMLCASNDADASNNSMQVCGEVVNSCDPNNKEVIPQGEGPDHIISKNQRMTYTINFKNTGNAPAIDVRVEDTIDTDVLDPANIRIMETSHEIDEVRIEEDSIFEFHYNDIMLPDSGTSQSQSEGFVRFSLDQVANLSDGTVIENNAAIFFDQNAPIITDTAMNKIGTPGALQGPDDAPELSVYPNPANERLHVRASEDMKGQVILRDMVGKQVLQRNLNGKRSAINVNELPSGVYLLSVQLDDHKEPVREKVLID